MYKKIYFISDGTGITAEALGNSLITQFVGVEFDKVTIPYVDTVEKAQQTVTKINGDTDTRPLVLVTLVNPEIRAVFKDCHGTLLDFFSTFLGPIEKELGVSSSFAVGKSHGVDNFEAYEQRIEAVNYALGHDDGIRAENYNRADLILIGVSRCGKTPSCLYLALQFGILAANYPITEEDLHHHHMPDALKSYKNKLFGLTIDAERLKAIRSERRPNSRYASIEQCRIELQEAETLYRGHNISFLNTTRYSIEEIATLILAKTGLRRRIS